MVMTRLVSSALNYPLRLYLVTTSLTHMDALIRIVICIYCPSEHAIEL